MTTFQGFPAGAFTFYERLAANNTRRWWNAHRAEYDSDVRAPMEALLADIAPDGAARVYRPYRDVRFSKDKSPLKDHQGAIVQVEDAIGYYVQVGADGLMVAAGWYAPLGRQVEAYRRAVDGPAGEVLNGITRGLRKRYDIDGDPVATRPRGVTADHPRLDLMRNRRLIAVRTYPVQSWMHTPRARQRISGDWRAMTPLVEWLIDHVGPATAPDMEP